MTNLSPAAELSVNTKFYMAVRKGSIQVRH